MSSKLLLNLQPDPNTGTRSQQLVDEAAEVLRYELGSENITGDTVTLSFYDGTSNAGTLLGTVDIPPNTDIESAPVTGAPGWNASTGIYVEVTAGEENWENGQSFVDIARTGETDVRREADKDTSFADVLIPAGAMGTVGIGSPTVSHSNNQVHGWSMPAASRTAIAGLGEIPPGVSTYDIVIKVVNLGTDTTNAVQVRAAYQGFVESGATTAVTFGTWVTQVPDIQGDWDTITLASGLVVPASRQVNVRVDRAGDIDTNTGAILITGVRLAKAS